MSQLDTDTAELRRFADQLRAAGVELGKLDEVNAQAGRLVVEASRPPRRSGALAASLRADAGAGGVDFLGTARHFTFIHFGAPRRNLRARPFFTEALSTELPRIATLYTEHTRNAIERNT